MKALFFALLWASVQFSSGVNLVEVYASVTDDKGQPMQGLGRDEFEVFEDGQLQEVSAFAGGEFPLSVAIAIDRSFSMNDTPLAMAKAAARRFAGELRPVDRAMLLAVGSETEVAAPLSADRAPLFDAISKLDAWGTTPLYDSISAAIELIQPTQGRRALVLLSDGVDRYSRATAAEVLSDARRADVLIYPVALGQTRPQVFAELAVVTGGRSFHIRDPKQLEDTFRSIATELRHQYLLGYAPSRPIGGGEPEWRSIQVKVKRPGVRVRARDGYLAND